MAQPGNFTPILLYSSSTAAAVPLAANLTNSINGAELAINIADKNLFFKDSGGVVNTVPIRQSGTSSNGWLSSTDWNTFNSKAPATSGTSILYGNGSGGFSNVTIGTGITFAGGTLSATGTGGTVTSVTGTSPVVSSGGTTPAISLATAYGDTLNPYASKTANYVLAAPNGSAGVPTFRALVAADVTGLGTMATQNANSVAITGGAIDGTTIGATTATTGKFTTVNASTSVSTPIVKATSSAGGALQNASGTSQIQWGAGGGNNVTIDVSANLNGTNAQIDISPTGTGHVHINPTGTGSIEMNPTSTGTIDNMTIGATTPKAITGTTITATTFVGSGASLTGVVTSVTGTAPVVSSGGTTPAISMAAATGSVNGYLTSTDWTTFNSKQPAGSYLTAVSVVSANGFAGTSSGGTTPALTLSTSITGLLKGNGTAISAATSGTDYAPATSGTSILYGNGAGGFSNVTVGTGLTFIGGTLASTASGGTVTSVAATVPSFLSIAGSPITTSGTLAISYSGTALPVANGGTGLTTLTAGYIPYGNGTSAFSSSGNLTFDGSNLSVTGNITNANIGANGAGFYGSAGSAFRFTLTRQDAISAASLYINAFGGIGFATGLGSGGTASSAPNMYLDTSGALFVGATSAPQTSKVFFTQTAVGGYTLGINAVSNSGTYYLVNLFAANTQTGTISSNGTTTVYGVTSDRRLKENIVPFTNGLAVISSLKPSEFNYKSNKDNIYQGFIADELQNVVPNAVIGNPDAVDEIGNPMYQSIDSSFLVPHLVAAIQELNAKFDAYVASHP
jgi:hypothetical protein